MSRIIKVYDKAYKANEFYRLVKRTILHGDDTLNISDDIMDSFGNFLNEEYDTVDIFNFTAEDKEDAADQFVEVCMSWLDSSGDIEELELED